MDYSWIGTNGTAVLMVIITAIGIYGSLVVFTRIAGLRSFSKMSSFDFAVTIAIGSTIGTIITSKSPSLLLGIVAIGMLYTMQIVVSYLRENSVVAENIVDNEPLLLMEGSNIYYDNMEKGRVTLDDLHAKLREANVTQISQIKAVVMESTGDISVLHGESGDELDSKLLDGVKGWTS